MWASTISKLPGLGNVKSLCARAQHRGKSNKLKFYTDDKRASLLLQPFLCKALEYKVKPIHRVNFGHQLSNVVHKNCMFFIFCEWALSEFLYNSYLNSCIISIRIIQEFFKDFMIEYFPSKERFLKFKFSNNSAMFKFSFHLLSRLSSRNFYLLPEPMSSPLDYPA